MKISTVLNPETFVESYSPRLQKYLINLIELAGLRKAKEVRDMTDKILDYTFDRLTVSGFTNSEFQDNSPNNIKFFPLDVLKNVLNMVNRRSSRKVVQKFLTIFDEGMNELLKSQPFYFRLRSLLEINSFPFDMDYLALKEFNESNKNRDIGVNGVEGYHLLKNDFQFIKINSTYMLKAQLRDKCEVN